jgi:hypothetical protein
VHRLSGNITNPDGLVEPTAIGTVSVACEQGDPAPEPFEYNTDTHVNEGGNGRALYLKWTYSMYLRDGLRCRPTTAFWGHIGSAPSGQTLENHSSWFWMSNPNTGAEVIASDLQRDMVMSRPPGQIRIEGRLLDSGGVPLRNPIQASSYLLTSPGIHLIQTVANVQPDGSFILNLIAGDYRLSMFTM